MNHFSKSAKLDSGSGGRIRCFLGVLANTGKPEPFSNRQFTLRARFDGKEPAKHEGAQNAGEGEVQWAVTAALESAGVEVPRPVGIVVEVTCTSASMGKVADEQAASRALSRSRLRVRARM
ncbi:MAG: hypothetical protein WAK33_11815 [Silvibacterium sp.]